MGDPEFSCQFKNRLFDRDTLFVHRYSINFLFVLSAYISRDSILKKEFRKRARIRFRKDIIEYIRERYVFFRVYHNEKSNNEKIINDNFRRYCGQMYRLKNDDESFIVAFEKDRDESVIKQLRIELEKIIGVRKVSLFDLLERT